MEYKEENSSVVWLVVLGLISVMLLGWFMFLQPSVMVRQSPVYIPTSTTTNTTTTTDKTDTTDKTTDDTKVIIKEVLVTPASSPTATPSIKN